MRMLARSGVSRASPDAEVTIWGIGVGGACAAASAMADAKRMTDAAIEIIELPIPTRMASTPKVDLKYLGARDFASGAMGEAARDRWGHRSPRRCAGPLVGNAPLWLYSPAAA